MDETDVLGALQAIRDGFYPGVDSMVVVRHGWLIAEGYFNGFGRESLHDLRSAGKSFTSALAGIAIEQGLLGIDDPISRHIPDFDSLANLDTRKRAITVYNLLNMTSGLDCDDWDPASPGGEWRMYTKQDWVRFILDLRVIHDPGSVASYCSGAVVVLGDIISRRAGMPLDDYANTYLFAPLGIQKAFWRRSPDGRATGGGGLGLRPRDLAKFGQLYLNGGTWNGVRVVSQAWVEQSQQRITSMQGDGYGLLWWKFSQAHGASPVEIFFAAGNGGNYVFVCPSLDLVVAFTASNYDSSLQNQPVKILSDRLLPAVQ